MSGLEEATQTPEMLERKEARVKKLQDLAAGIEDLEGYELVKTVDTQRQLAELYHHKNIALKFSGILDLLVPHAKVAATSVLEMARLLTPAEPAEPAKK